MCGIFGFNFSDRKLAAAMAKILNHRGPDHADTYSDEKFTLGYTRLSIIDIKGGNQPIFNEDHSIVLFFNGEIYNASDLREKLEKKGHRFYTDTDTEVIVHSYEEYGKECLNYFNGMFAFALYDTEKKELFIARDRLGIKPLYYFHDGSKFIFASEIKAILEHKEIDRKLNENLLDGYFSFRYCSGEETMLKEIYKLNPGHYLVYNSRGISIKKYWDVTFSPGNKSLEYYKKQFLQLKNEFEDARVIAEKFGTEHHECTIDSSYISLLPKITWHMDEPLADPIVISNYVLAEKASKDIRVLLNGDGADEIFAGYEQYRIMKAMKKIPRFIKQAGGLSLNLLPREPFFMKTKDFLESDDAAAFLNISSVFSKDEKKVLLKDNVKESSLGMIRKNFRGQEGLVNKMIYHDMKTYLPDDMLLKYDKVTMANSIEGRVPFCDHTLAEFSASLPEQYKINLMTEKYIIRQAMKDFLPKSTIKKKKMRFMVPTDTWYKQDFGEYARNILDEKKDIVDRFFKKSYVDRLLSSDRMLSGRLLSFNRLTSLYYSRQLWSVTNFILWHKIFIEGEKPR